MMAVVQLGGLPANSPRDFPRSAHSCLGRAALSLHAITGSPVAAFNNKAQQQPGRLLAELNFTQIGEIIHGGLHEFLDDLQTGLNRIDDAVFETFFTLRPLTGNSVQQQSRA